MNANKQDAGGEVTNPDNVGGLPELPEPAAFMKRPSAQNSYNREEPYFTASQMRAYGELCRAAPAGGDVSSTWEYGCDAPRNGGAPYIGATIGGHFVRFRIEDDFADAVKRHTFLRTLQSHLNAAPAGGDDESTDYRCECGKLNYRPLPCANCGEPSPKDAAPAGSGEVHRAMNAIETVAWLALRKTPEQLGEEAWLAIKHPPHPSEVPHIQRFDWTEDGMEPVRPECHGPNEYVRWDDYAALLRKLQQGAECFVREMRTSKGSEFFVVVRCNGRELTPHMYTERWKAEYDVASWQHLLCGAPEPDLLAYGPDAASQGQEGGHG